MEIAEFLKLMNIRVGCFESKVEYWEKKFYLDRAQELKMPSSDVEELLILLNSIKK